MSPRSVRKKRHHRKVRFDGIEFTEIAEDVFVHDEAHSVESIEAILGWIKNRLGCGDFVLNRQDPHLPKPCTGVGP